jgi:putative transposase
LSDYGFGAITSAVLLSQAGARSPDPPADTITEIHQRSRGTCGRRRVRAALLADYEMNVNLKLVSSIMTEHGLYGLPRPTRRLPNLIRVATPADLVNRCFTATRPNELWCTDITEHPARDGHTVGPSGRQCFDRTVPALGFARGDG